MTIMFQVTRIDEGTYPVQFRTYAIGTYADFWTAYGWAQGEAKGIAIANHAAIASTCYDSDGEATFIVERVAKFNLSGEVYSTITVTPAQ